MYGREARLPIDIALTDSEREENTQELTLDEKVGKMIEFPKKSMSKLKTMYSRHKRNRSNSMMTSTMGELSCR